jgi:hypothetical protein
MRSAAVLSGHVSCFHAVTVALFHPSVRRNGTCTLCPIQCSSMCTPPSVRKGPNRCQATPAIQARVQGHVRRIDALLWPRPFSCEAASLPLGLLAAARAGILSAGEDELRNNRGSRHGIASTLPDASKRLNGLSNRDRLRLW